MMVNILKKVSRLSFVIFILFLLILPVSNRVYAQSNPFACDLPTDEDVCCGLREYSAVLGNFGRQTSEGDFNGDNNVTLVDHGIVLHDFGQCGSVNPTNPPSGEIAPPPNTLVAFIGDTGLGSNFDSTLNLIKNEGAHFVMHQGDAAYSSNVTGWGAQIDSILGTNFPYFVSAGNHDTESGRWPGYAAWLEARIQRVGGVQLDDPNIDDEAYNAKFMGFNLVFSYDYDSFGQENQAVQFIQTHLQNSNYIWNICSWHQNQRAMQIGGKEDDIGWGPYDKCRELGAIIATGHEHSYERTKTLTSMQSQTVDITCSDPANVCVRKGATFAFVSGLGGASIRGQERCLPTTYPYGCKGEWAKIYTQDQSAKYGVLFIRFNVDGNPRKAVGYFKNINGQIIDQFTITKQ